MRWLAILLLFTVTSFGTGVTEWLHVHAEHEVRLSQSAINHGTEFGVAGHDHGVEAGHCLICFNLHAPILSSIRIAFEVSVSQVVDRVLDLQAQRVDASVPAVRGCRGPPVVM